MTITAISDTHGQHRRLKLRRGDMLIHAGDVSMSGKEDEIAEFLKWFSLQPFRYKIFIPGNHDFFFEKKAREVVADIIPPNVIYLNDSGTTVEGINVWGSPITPYFFNWAFNRSRGPAIRKHWDLIPADTNILITHGPVYGFLDQTSTDENVGCQDLLRSVLAIKPALHICGHIHEGYGALKSSGTQFVNACVLDEAYRNVNAPVQLIF